MDTLMNHQISSAIPVQRRPLTRHELAQVRSAGDWADTLRPFEFRSVFEEFPPERFETALELGCGAGLNSVYLEPWCKRLIATDCDAAKLRGRNTNKTEFMSLDAQDLSRFSNASLDLIFSSNLIEHLPQVEKCLSECARVVKPDGYVIHLVPSRTWKLANLLFFYPDLALAAVARIGNRRDAADDNGPEPLDDNLRPMEVKRSLAKRLFPRIHGYSRSHREEWMRWDEKRWLCLFENSAFRVHRIVRLPFYMGYGYTFPRLLSLGNRAGLSSSTGYILQRA